MLGWEAFNWTHFLLEMGLKSLVILALVSLVLWFWRRASAAFRHAIWLASLLVLLALPLFVILLPALPIIPVSKVKLEATGDLTPSVVEGARAPSKLPVSMIPFRQQNILNALPLPKENLESTAFWLVAWVLGAGIMLLVTASHYCWRRHWMRDALPLQEPKWLGTLAHLKTHRRTSIILLVSSRVSVPITWGWRQAYIVVPAAAQYWPQNKIRAVLLHELAHVHRWDALTQSLAQFVRALYWFNPLVWYALKELHLEQERACDDQVLKAGERASEYGRHLLDIAKGYYYLHGTSGAGVTMARSSTVAQRIHALVDETLNRRPPTPGQWCSIGATSLLVAGLLAPVALSSTAAEAQPGDAVQRTSPLAEEDTATPNSQSMGQKGGSKEETVVDSVFEKRIQAAWSDINAYFETHNPQKQYLKQDGTPDLDRPQWKFAAREQWQYYLEHPRSKTGKTALVSACMIWGNIGAYEEAKEAVPTVDTSSDLWPDIIVNIARAYADKEKNEEFYQLLNNLEKRLTHPRSKSEALWFLAEWHLKEGRVAQARSRFQTLAQLQQGKRHNVIRAKSYLFEADSLSVGQSAPDLKAVGIDGREVHLATMRDKVVVLDFWGMDWTGSSGLSNHAVLKKLYDELPADDFQTIGFVRNYSGELNMEKLGQYLTEQDIQWPQVIEAAIWQDGDLYWGEIMTTFNVYYPRSFILDRKGRIVGKDLEKAALEQVVRELVAVR